VQLLNPRQGVLTSIVLVVALQVVQCFQVARGRISAQSRKQRLFLIGRVSFPANVKILQRRLHRGLLFAG